MVNYPDLKVLNPNQPASRGDIAAFVHQALVAQGRIEPLRGEVMAVIIRLLEAIATIADYTCDRKDRAVLLRHAAAIKRDSYENVSDKLDKPDIDEQYLVVEKSLRSG